MIVAPLSPSQLDALIAAAQAGDEHAATALLQQFRPLLRSRMHALWAAIRDGFSTLEWDDVEAQITFLFLNRLQAYRRDAGVYFPHYIEKMLDLDARYWLRCQRRGAATPFSQLACFGEEAEEDEGSDWLFNRLGSEEAPDIERNLALRAALDALPAPQREVVWQCCVLGRTEVGVALELGVSRSAIRHRLEAAIATMRAFFADTGADSDKANHTLSSRDGSAQDGGASHFSPDAQVLTRTGRVSRSRVIDARQQFWEGLILMAKDEKRPDLVGVGAGRPVLLQGTFDFPETGLKTPALLSKKLTYTVPPGHVLGVRYLRVGSVSEGMVAIYTVVNGLPHRIVPCAANSTTHVSFAIVDPIIAGSQIEIHVASQCTGIAIIDVGCLQMPA